MDRFLGTPGTGPVRDVRATTRKEKFRAMEEKGFTARERLRQVLGAADLMAGRPPVPYPAGMTPEERAQRVHLDKCQCGAPDLPCPTHTDVAKAIRGAETAARETVTTWYNAHRFTQPTCLAGEDRAALVEALRGALRAAVLEEREACARVIEPKALALFWDMAKRGLFVRDDVGQPSTVAAHEIINSLTAAIRARG